MWRWLDALHALLPVTALAHGCATGADTLADGWARSVGIEPAEFRAEWRRYGRTLAGSVRNRKMLHVFKPHVLVAFPGGSGTADCVAAARELGIPVLDLRGLLAA